MIRDISAETLQSKIGNTYQLVVAASERVRQLAGGARPLVKTTSKKLTTTALLEIEQDKVFLVGADDLPDKKVEK
jgi:DNA-directed RNA polymerase omega subunit